MVGREQSRQTRKFACFGITRRKRDGWAGSNAGKLASLLALLWRGARRYGWVGSKASKLASLPALVERDARLSGWVGIKACLACLLASLLACLLQGRFSAPRQLPGFRSLLSGILTSKMYRRSLKWPSGLCAAEGVAAGGEAEGDHLGRSRQHDAGGSTGHAEDHGDLQPSAPVRMRAAIGLQSM